MQVLVLIAVTAATVEAYVSRNDGVSYTADVTSYRKFRPRNFLLGPPFADEIMGQQISLNSQAKDQTLSQQAFQDVSLRDRAVYPFKLPILRHQPFKHNTVTATTYGQPTLFRDTPSKSQEIRGQRATVEENPFVGQATSFASDEIFEEQASTYQSQVPLKEQLFTAGASLKNLLLHGQSVPAEQASFQKQVGSAEFPSISNTKVYRDDNKPIDSYGRHKDVPSYGGSWTEYDDHALGMSSMPMIPEYVSLSNSGEVDSLEAYRTKFGPMPILRPATSTSNGKCNALVNSSPTATSGAATTVPSISVSTNQSSIVGHILTSLTTKPSSAVTAMATPIAFTGNFEPIYFHATKYGAALTSLPTKSELKSNLMPEAPKNSMKTDIQSSMSNILSEEYKNGLKSALANYALPEGLKQDWSLQQFAQPESSGYVPLSLNGKTNLIVPSLPVASIPTISWPMETKTDVTAILPARSVMTVDTATSNDLPIGLTLPSDFMGSIPNSLPPSIPNSISGSITGSISTSIPSGMTPGMPASIPTLSLGQSLHRAEQLQQTQEPRNLWYPTGLQVQLGGFGGINYTLHASNTAMRPMELGMAGAGLTPPKLPQAHVPAFAKVSSQGVIASFASPGTHVARKLP